MRLPEFGVKYPVTNLMIFIAVLVLGAISLSRLPIDLMPEIEPPAISVVTVYEGAGAEDVETKVTEIVENNLATISNLDKLTSRSMEGLSVVTCRFEWGTNLDEASNDIRDKIEFAKRLLPEEIDPPIVFKFNTTMIPILFIGANAERSYGELHHIIDKQLGDYLKRIPGVGAVQQYGALERQINIKLDRARLESRHLSVQAIVSRLAAENITLPSGDLKMGYLDYTLRVLGEFKDPVEIKDIVVGQEDDKQIYLKDVADIEDSYKEETMIVRNNGKSGLMMMVQKRSGANTVAVAERVKKALIEVKGRLPKDVKVFTLMDSSEHITLAINNLSQTVYWGGIFVIIVVYLFLRQIRSSLIIALTIPFSLIIAFIYMFMSGYTINIMSLSSLAIAIGMVVDNAIVVVDNVIRHRDRGIEIKEAAISGTAEVGLAVSASTFTTVVVFLPLIFLKGIVGIIFKQLAALITVSLLASLFTALTFSPMLCSKLLIALPQDQFREKRKKLYQRFYIISGRFLEYIESRYAALLTFSLKHKKTVIFTAIAIFVLSILLIPKIGTEFMPEEDSGDLSLQIEMPPGTRVEETDRVAKEVENIFRDGIPEMEQLFSRSGQSSSGRFGAVFGQRTGSNVTMVGAKLVSSDKRDRSAREIAESLRPKIKALAGVKKIDIRAGSPFSRILFGGGKPVSIEILGHDFTATDELAYLIKEKLSKIPGLVDITISRELGEPELQIEIDRIKASSLGLSMARITDSIRTYFYGKTATKYREGGDEYDVFVRLKESDRTNIQDIENIPIASSTDKLIRLSNVAKIIHKTGPVGIERQNQERIIKVEANIFRRSLGDVSKEVKTMLADTPLPKDVVIGLGSDIEEQAKSFKDLFILFMLGGILVYMVMAAQFESLLYPFIIMFSVPFAFCGVAFSLLISGITLSIISFLGLIMLSGIVVNNAIVLISYINILRSRGIALYEAITQGCANRLRPVLMTTITTLFGMLPLAISHGEGSESWRPLGVSMLGGLTFSTLITLVLVPVLYAGFSRHPRHP